MPRRNTKQAPKALKSSVHVPLLVEASKQVQGKTAGTKGITTLSDTVQRLVHLCRDRMQHDVFATMIEDLMSLPLLAAGSGAVLPPAGTSPHVLANAIKHFLVTMPEPLLTYK